MKKCIVIVSLIIVGLAGCQILDNLFDPNTATIIQQGTEAVGSVATATGMPWGWMIITAGSIFSACATAYRNYRNKGQAADKYQEIEITTQAIVRAIESVANVTTTDGKTVGDIVKAEVKNKLEGQRWYGIGKAIITGLKNK